MAEIGNAHKMDDWKENLNFTGDCFVFPAEMFAMLIEKKFGLKCGFVFINEESVIIIQNLKSKF